MYVQPCGLYLGWVVLNPIPYTYCTYIRTAVGCAMYMICPTGISSTYMPYGHVLCMGRTSYVHARMGIPILSTGRSPVRTKYSPTGCTYTSTYILRMYVRSMCRCTYVRRWYVVPPIYRSMPYGHATSMGWDELHPPPKYSPQGCTYTLHSMPVGHACTIVKYAPNSYAIWS